MCSNFEAVVRTERLKGDFGVVRQHISPLELKPEVWPLSMAPMIRLDERGARTAEAAQFGLVPHWAKELAYGRRTYNSRSETVGTLNSFKEAWKRGQRCIIPTEAIYEPCYETGKAVRWRIEGDGGVPMGIAGIYVDHPHLKRSDGAQLLSFAMLTVNADGHPVFQRMHGPEDEKRMVVYLDPASYDDWLTCATEQAPDFFRQWSGQLTTSPRPLPPRASKRATMEKGS